MSLRSKIVALVIGLNVAILGGLWVLLAGSWAGWSSEATDRELHDRAEALAAIIEVEDGDGIELEEKHAAKGLRDPAHPFRIVGPGGGPLFAEGELAWPEADPGASVPRTSTVEDAGRSWRVLTMPLTVREKHGRGRLRLAVQVAGEVAANRALEERFRSGLLLALAAALLAGGVGAAVLAHVSLAPLRRRRAPNASPVCTPRRTRRL